MKEQFNNDKEMKECEDVKDKKQGVHKILKKNKRSLLHKRMRPYCQFYNVQNKTEELNCAISCTNKFSD
jgi:hypothetical protein